jgi:hypothetical protein
MRQALSAGGCWAAQPAAGRAHPMHAASKAGSVLARGWDWG